MSSIAIILVTLVSKHLIRLTIFGPLHHIVDALVSVLFLPFRMERNSFTAANRDSSVITFGCLSNTRFMRIFKSSSGSINAIL